MADVRSCDQCGVVFAPRREHARFCSAACREAWNRENQGDPSAALSALEWSVTEMTDIARRLPGVHAGERPRALAVIAEMVWRVTIVDATLVRHHHDAYDRVLASRSPAGRQLINGTMAGLRFVRNRMEREADQVDFISPPASNQAREPGPVTAWTWNPVPEPTLASLPPRGQAWEMTRYGAYQNHLAGHATGETFGRATNFLTAAAALVTSMGATAPR